MRAPALFVWAFFCALLGLGIVYLKVTRLSIPLDASAEATVWDVEARVAFEGRGEPAKIKLTLPDSPRGFAVLDEDFVSRGFGLAVSNRKEGTRRAVWTIRRAKGQHALYYHVKAYPKRGDAAIVEGPPPIVPEVPEYAEPLGSAVTALLNKTREQSADVATFTGLLLTALASPDDENAQVIRKSVSAAELTASTPSLRLTTETSYSSQ